MAITTHQEGLHARRQTGTTSLDLLASVQALVFDKSVTATQKGLRQSRGKWIKSTTIPPASSKQKTTSSRALGSAIYKLDETMSIDIQISAYKMLKILRRQCLTL